MPTPSSMAWVHSFSHSLGGALGTTVTTCIEKTVNPLVFALFLTFGEPVAPKDLLQVWNLLQRYAARNECDLKGKLSGWGLKLRVDVVTRKRHISPMDYHPLA